jgi:predicted MFS family arabinose efflux permease
MRTQELSRNRSYLRYRAARTVSVLGSQLSGIAYPLLVLHLGGSAVEAGAVSSCWLVSRAVCRLPAGQLADRLNRRWLMIGTDVIRLIAVGTIPLAAAWNDLTYPQLVIVAILEGAATSAFEPASSALVRDLVPAAELSRALGQGQGLTAAASLAGPALGGLSYGLNPVLPFIADASSYGLSAVLLLAVRVPWSRLAAPAADATEISGPGRSGPDRSSPDRSGSVGSADAGREADQRVTAGLRWLWSKPAVMRVLAFAAVINLVATATQVAVIVILRQRGTSADVIGVVMACLGGGAIVGALLSRHIMEWLDPPRLCLAIGAAWIAGFSTFALVSSPWVFGPLLAIMFLLAPPAGVMLGTITLGQAPRNMLGRVTTAEQTVTNSLVIAGPALAGLLLEALGVSSLWLILGACCLLVTAASIGPLLTRGSSGRAPRTTVGPAEPARRR